MSKMLVDCGLPLNVRPAACKPPQALSHLLSVRSARVSPEL